MRPQRSPEQQFLDTKFAWRAKTFAWHAKTFAWHAKTFAWRAKTLAWHAKAFAWRAKTLAWHAKAFAWHAKAFAWRGKVTFDAEADSGGLRQGMGIPRGNPAGDSSLGGVRKMWLPLGRGFSLGTRTAGRCRIEEMSAAVKPNTGRNASAFVVSIVLHGSMLLLPILDGLSGRAPQVVQKLPNSVAMVGNSIEVEAPTAELAATPGAAVPAPEPGPHPRPEPVDVKTLPAEAEPRLPTEAEPRADAKSSPSQALEKAAPVAASPAKPRAAPKSAKPPRASASAVAAGSEAATTGAPAAGTFGQEGLAPGVRRLGYAFTRAIPAATPADAEWRELPTGKVGTIRIELEVDENNRLGAMKQWQARAGEPAPPAVLLRMVERTLLLLRAGQFALSGSNQPGTERLVIDVQLRDEAAEGEGESVVVQKGFDGASPGHPGRAHFRYGNGRAFEAKVTIVRVAPR